MVRRVTFMEHLDQIRIQTDQFIRRNAFKLDARGVKMISSYILSLLTEEIMQKFREEVFDADIRFSIDLDLGAGSELEVVIGRKYRNKNTIEMKACSSAIQIKLAAGELPRLMLDFIVTTKDDLLSWNTNIKMEDFGKLTNFFLKNSLFDMKIRGDTLSFTRLSE